MEGQLFSVADYLVFGAMLLVSAGIGLYHGCVSCARKQADNLPADFLTGNGQLRTWPVAVSMLASFLSSITLMGQPAEVYLFGPQLWLFGIASLLCVPLVCYVFIPFYHKHKFTSAYEYFGKRFHKNVQLLASVLFTVQMVLYLALVLYAPALALYQVTGLNTEVIVSVMYIVVIFYTTLGGIKAVVWTDCFQVVVLFTSMLAVLIKGTLDIGGFDVVWERNSHSGRTQLFNWSPDPTERYTVWSSLIGAAALHNAVYGANQLQVQRYLTVKTVSQARRMVWINVIGWTAVVLLTVYAGMLIFAKYFDCDPMAAQILKKPDQLFPLYVMNTLGEYPGFPGLFVAGIFSAGLSTVSTGLNSLAAIWYSQMQNTRFGVPNKGDQAVKIIALVFGLLSFALVFIVPYMGGLVPVAISLSGFFSGALFGLFILGMFFPSSNSIGASFGLVFGIGVVAWLSIGSQIATEMGQKVFTPLPTSTTNCSSNITLNFNTQTEKEPSFILYRISFLWYSLLSILVTILVGVIMSWITNFRGLNLKGFSLISGEDVSRPERCTEKKVDRNPCEESNKLLLKEGVKEMINLNGSSAKSIPV